MMAFWNKSIFLYHFSCNDHVKLAKMNKDTFYKIFQKLKNKTKGKNPVTTTTKITLHHQ